MVTKVVLLFFTAAVEPRRIPSKRHYPSSRQKAIASWQNLYTVKKIRVWIKRQFGWLLGLQTLRVLSTALSDALKYRSLSVLATPGL
jgi:hypothetical protein